MQKVISKYIIASVMILVIFAAGFIAGCAGKNEKSVAGKMAQHAIALLPDGLKGVHTFPAAGAVDVAFSPAGGITAMVTGEIARAQKSIQVQAYSFTSPEIATALIEAKKRGVDVRIVLDKSNITGDDKDNPRDQKEKELLDSIAASGIGLKVDYDFQIAHNKIMIIDGVDIITGSFNFTKSAEHANAENCLILHGNKQLAAEYAKYWQWRWDATQPYGK